jgi:hypothetical protein
VIKKPEYVEGRQAFKNFENGMDALMRVPHREIKAKLDAEKREKTKGRSSGKETGRRVKPC